MLYEGVFSSLSITTTNPKGNENIGNKSKRLNSARTLLFCQESLVDPIFKDFLVKDSKFENYCTEVSF